MPIKTIICDECKKETDDFRELPTNSYMAKFTCKDCYIITLLDVLNRKIEIIDADIKYFKESKEKIKCSIREIKKGTKLEDAMDGVIETIGRQHRLRMGYEQPHLEEPGK